MKAKTLIWDKNKYKEVNVSGFKKNSGRDDGIFFDDSYYYSFDYPSVASRNRTQLAYRELMKEPRFAPGFSFVSYIPQAKSSFIIKAPADVELYCKVINDPGNLIQFRKTEKGKIITYEWTAKNLAAAKIEEGSPSLRYYEPHVVCYVKSYKGKSKTFAVLPDLDALYSWYATYVHDINKVSSDELASVVATIKATSKNERELAENIFYWVQDNIQYIAFEDGMRGFIPHPGSYTCGKRYGDCKDMANLIVNMMGLAGLKAYHTWIGTRDIPYRYTELPTPHVDNHMIATYISPKGEYFFLDATAKYTPFGYPSSMIQGKEALIGKSDKDYEVRVVPVVERNKNEIIDSVTVRIQNGQLVGSGNCSFTGLMKVTAGYELNRIDEKDIRESVTRFVGKGNNKFLLDQFDVKNLSSRKEPTAVDYKFSIRDYHKELGEELYVNLHLRKDNYNRFIIEGSRKTPHEFDFKYNRTDIVEFIIPDGFVVDYLPPSDSHPGKFMGYTITYKVTGNKISFRKSYYIDYLLMLPADFKTWNEDVRKISEAFKESIILKKKI
jgi:hypothetical protein